MISNLETRELETRKVRSNMDNAVMSLNVGRQEVHQGETERAVINIHIAEGRINSLLGVCRDLGKSLRVAKRERGDARDRDMSLIDRSMRLRRW